MKKLYALIVLLIIGSAFAWATSYTVKVIDLRPTVSPSGGSTTFGLTSNNGSSYTIRAAAEAYDNTTFPDSKSAATFGAQSIDISYNVTGASRIEIAMETGDIYNVNIYFTAPNNTSNPEITIYKADSYGVLYEQSSLSIEYQRGNNYSYGDDAMACVAIIGSLDAGTYYFRTVGYLGGFAGMTFSDSSTGGVYEDLFTKRVISADGKTSTWTYEGYSNTTHGLCGGVEDNDILHISSDVYGVDGVGNREEKNSLDNTNGNISFTLTNDGNKTPFLSVTYGSWVYIPVPKGSSGTIKMISIQDSKDTDTGRYFVIQDDVYYKRNGDTSRPLEMKTQGSEISFRSSDIVTTRLDSDDPVNIKEKGKDPNQYSSYIRLKHYSWANEYDEDNKYLRDAKELKIKSFEVKLTSGSYDFPDISEETHDIPGDHTHAIFNYSEANPTGDYEYITDKKTSILTNGTITIEKGTAKNTELQGVRNTGGSDSKLDPTPVFKDYSGGDMIKYKDSYYSGIQMITKDGGAQTVSYKLVAPTGYYFTTSVRLHGYRNYDKGTSDANKPEKSDPVYVANLNHGYFSKEQNNTNSTCDFYRDDKNARTTTLDFEVPASKEIPFQFGGYQFLGVIDAVLTRTNTVGLPSEKAHMYFNVTSKNNPVIDPNKPSVDLTTEIYENESRFTYTTDGKDQRDGELHYVKDAETIIITYDPTSYRDETLYWYFEPSNIEYLRKGTLDITYNGVSGAFIKELEDYDTGSQYDNVTKTFGVRNYRFVTASGKLKADDGTLKKLYGLDSSSSNIRAYATTDAEGESTEGESTEGESTIDDPNINTNNKPLELTITGPGTLYYYSKNNDTKLNGPLVTTVFMNDKLSGIDNVVVEEESAQYDANAPIYNVYGQRVDSNYRGVVIKNGRKYLQR